MPKQAYDKGPSYPELGQKVAAFRRIHNPTREQRHAHGAAVINAVLRKQRSEMRIDCAEASPNCASGTWHSDSDAILTAIRAQQHAALSRAVANDRKRTPEIWRKLYEKAMKEKAKYAETSRT